MVFLLHMARLKKPLPIKDIEKKLKAISDWDLQKKGTILTKSFSFPSFITGLAFAAKITVHAEVMNHHPVIELSYGTVKVTLTTDDAKGLTNADFELAKKIDALRIT